jgi:penicillin-binding protein 1B
MTSEQETTNPLPQDTTPEVPQRPARPPFFERREGRILLFTSMGLFGVFLLLFGYSYVKFGPTINKRLESGPFSGTVNIYSAPRSVAVGEAATPEEIVTRLRHAGYTTARGNTVGWYNVRPNAVEIFPGRDSYAGGEPGVLEFANSKISRIVSLQDHTERKVFDLEPQLLANLTAQRERRRLIHFNDIPKNLVNAVVSVEDKHFFQHSGVDLVRVVKAAYVDLKEGRKEQGASTLSMQLARGFWLDPDKNWMRKLQEIAITLHLERKLTKQQIFEYYANQIYLGRHGTFSVHGFGEAAHIYFGKDLNQLTLPESALLAGLIQRPSYFNPFRYADRAKERRNIVLLLMRQNDYIDDSQYRSASAAPIEVHAEKEDFAEAQFFIDLMNEEAQAKLDERPKQPRFIYTTLDSDLQDAAQKAVAAGMESVDKQLGCGQLAKKGAKSRCGSTPPQVALIALDPHTGEIRALVGGRDYNSSQLNHVVAMRPPGSVFKPFVYAAALETGIAGGSTILTPATTVEDEPTTFFYGRQSYTPSNFRQHFMGTVTLRNALAHSLNVATVQVAQEVGLDRVVKMARRVGLNDGIQATPAVALGAYDTTPLEIAGAYTTFANDGVRVTPTTISLARAPDGTILYQHEPDRRTTLDPRINYLMVSMMQDVLRYGTGAGVHARGFNLPAAGKTGTSHDGWFAGFTSNLLCVVWVGFDDYRELNLEGAKSALPIWADFMKQASKLRRYDGARNFQAPSGIVSATICPDSGELAGPNCPSERSDVFISGTQPAVECRLHSLGITQQFADRIDETPTTRSSSAPPAAGLQQPVAPTSAATAPRSVPPATNPVPVAPPGK